MSQTIGVIILTRNDQQWLPAALESAKWADQIVVVDDGSTDQTLKIARQYTDKIVELKQYEEQIDFSQKRNVGLEKISTDWVFYLDSDERILATLKEEISQILNSKTVEVAWAVPRRNVILGEEKSYSAFWPDYVIRLFKRSALRQWSGKVHEQPEFDGQLALHPPYFRKHYLKYVIHLL